MTLGLALAQSRRIAPTLLTQLEQSAREKRTQLIDELVSSGIMSAHDLAVFVAGKYQMPLLDLAQYKLDAVPAVLSANRHFQQLRLLPLGRRDNRIIVATSDPSDPKPIEELRQKMNVAIETVIVEHDKLVRQLSLANEAPTEIKSLIPKQEATQIEYDPGAAAAVRRTTTDGIDDAPVVRFLQKLFTEALLRGTSDLHFEPFETFYRVRFRIDGILAQVAQPPLDIRDKIATRIKVLSRLDISEKRVPQDGRMKLLITVPKDKNDKDNKETIERAIDFRVSTLPTLFGEKIVIRILESSTERLDIDQLGYEPEQKQLLLDVIKRPYGMVLVTGPTGSGKTVSLYTFLNKLNQGDINISTAEDPAEIQLPGINQVNVNDKAADLRRGAEIVPAAGSGHHHGGRNPGPGNRRHLHQGRADRPLGVLHAAHQRCADHAHAADEHGRGTVQHRIVGADDHGAASGAAPVQGMQEAGPAAPGNTAGGRFQGSRPGRLVAAVPSSRLRGMQRQRLQGPGRHLPGHADHRGDPGDHPQPRHGTADRRTGAQGRRALAARFWPAESETGADFP